MNSTKLRHLFLLISITFLSSVFFWLSFYFDLPGKIGMGHVSMETIWANYDGPNYLAISQCGYRPECLRQNFSLPLSLEYYPAHFPGYPVLINLLMPFSGNGPKAMLLVTLFGSLIQVAFSYLLFTKFFNYKKSFILTLLSIYFPARFFALRQIGAPETWFLATIIGSIYFFKSKKYLLSAIFGAFAQSLKSPGLILFISYFFLFIIKYRKHGYFNWKKYIYYLLSPLTILFIFYAYYLQTGDFWAYFHSGDNIHLSIVPYSVFLSRHTWIDTIWLEDVIYIFGLTFVGLFSLYHRHRLKLITLFPLLFTIATVFVGHRDISRYISPVYPFLFIAFAEYLTKKRIILIFILLLPAVILYSLNFVAGNQAPISNWAPYL